MAASTASASTASASSASDCNIVALNAKAIQLVHHSNDREAIKLFLQALSRLKSELSTCHTHTSHNPAKDGAFLRVPLLSSSKSSGASAGGSGEKLGTPSSSSASDLLIFDRLLGLCSNVDPCSPQVRDGATALLLYNAGVTEHHMALFQDTNPQQKSLHQKKACQIYNMAFSAAQHWKRYTIEHSGYSVLSLAILNNLLSIQHNNSNTDNGNSNSKVDQLQKHLREELAMAKNTITEEERAFFANNLDQIMNSNSTTTTKGTSSRSNSSSSSSSGSDSDSSAAKVSS